MTLTIGGGPFGSQPEGTFNFEYEKPGSVLYWEDSPRRVRAELGGRTVADSSRMKLLHETRRLPVYYFPREDVDMALLEESGARHHCPHKGDARFWTVRVGDRAARDAAWSYPQPIEGAPPLGDYIAFDWSSMDRWLEEDEEVEGHPRDPYTRVDVRESSRHVRILVGRQLLAETERPKLLFETSLPVRIYVPRRHVRTELMERSHTTTYCPYKGRAAWWSARAGEDLTADVGWSYPDPFPEASKVRDHLSFLHPDVVVELDGERLTRQEHPPVEH